MGEAVMEVLKMYSNGGSLIATLPSAAVFVQSAVVSSSYMSNDTLTISCSSRENVAFEVGSYVAVDNVKYRMNQSPQKAKNGASGGYEYTLVFESVKYDLLNVRFLLPDETKDDFLTANLKELVGHIARNACRVYGTGSWIVGTVPDTEVITQQFTEMNCLAALQSMMNAFKSDFDQVYEFRVSYSNGHNIINVYEEDGGDVANIHLSYGHNGGIYKIERRASSSENIVTRLYAYGSSENIPTGYRHSRLCMRDKTRNGSYIESSAAKALYGLKEGFVTFDSIKPRAKFYVSSVSGPQGTSGAQGYRIKSNDLLGEYGFNMGDNWKARSADGGADYAEWLERYGYADGQSARDFYDQGGSTPAAVLKVVGTKKYVTNGEVTVTFNSGRCAGITFKIVDGTLSADGSEFNLVIQKNDEDTPSPYVIPSYSGDPLNPSTYEIMAGDEFVIANIDVPVGIIRKAEDELVLEAQKELAQRCKANARYAVEFDQIAKDSMNLSGLVPGNFVYVQDSALGLSDSDKIKVSKVEKNLINGDISVELTNIKLSKRIAGTAGITTGDVERIDIDGVRQTTLECQFVANYNGDADKIYVGGGRFDNYTLAGVRRIWSVSEDVLTIPTGHEYDIYVLANKKTSNATIILRRNVTIEREVVGGSYRQNISGVVIGAVSNGCYYFRIGKISKARKIHGKIGTFRTITLDYGTYDVSANDVNVFVSGAQFDLADRVNKDYANVKVLTDTLKSVKDSLHSVIQTMQNGHVSGSSISFNWSKCDDVKCQEVSDPKDLIPTIGQLE